MTSENDQLFSQRLDNSISEAVKWLRQEQHEDGHWVGFLKTNSTIEAEWVMAMHILGIKDDPKYKQVVRTILNEQRADGSWEVYYQAPNGDMSATVECYTALRLAGHSPKEERMQNARQWIFTHGGLRKIRVFTRFWLALLGEWPWEHTPCLPPELILLPNWSPLNLYSFASWGRATIIALILVTDSHPVFPMPLGSAMDELFPMGRDKMDYSMPKPTNKSKISWFFYYADKFLHYYSQMPYRPLHDTALKACIEWIVARQESDGCWAGIQPPWINAVIGLHLNGYALDHPVVKAGLDCFNEPWAYTNEKGTYLQCCTSPVWDTVLALQALSDCGLKGDDESVQKAVNYTLREQIHTWGDWSLQNPRVPSGGWCFEYNNDVYPDIDDSAVALLSLARMFPDSPPEVQPKLKKALEDGIKWIEGMRSTNGGWGAFDKDNDNDLVAKIPFSDFGEVLDPPSADVTGHVIEVLGFLGRTIHNDKVVAQAVRYLRKEQEEEGCWFGRWGVNYIYGTGWILPGLKAAGVDMKSDWVRKAAQWLIAKQNKDGGWGETCRSYMNTQYRGVGDSTPSQTGWALMGLLAMEGHEYDDAIKRGIEYLTSTQKQGTWEQKEYTGTGFPGYGIGQRVNTNDPNAHLSQGDELCRGFMLNYAMYRHYFPLMALGRARRHFQVQEAAPAPAKTGNEAQ